MTDKEFDNLIQKTKKAQIKYFQLLDKAEEEYERRFGAHPSDVNDDFWIDAMHYPKGKPNFVEIIKKAKKSMQGPAP